MRYLLVIGAIVILAGQVQGQSYFKFDFETRSTLPVFKPIAIDYELLENPLENKLNPSLLVGKVEKIPGKSLRWSGVVTRNKMNVDLTKGGKLKIKVFATTKKGTVQVKFENSFVAAYSKAKVTKLKEWEELEFSFKPTPHNFAYFLLSFDIGSVENHTFYFDDIQWIEGSVRGD